MQPCVEFKSTLNMNKVYLILFVAFCIQKLNAQTDTIPPNLVCKTNFSTMLIPNCLATVWATDLLESVYDESLPIELGVRKICTGTGFPEKNHIRYSAEAIGQQTIELWARDAAGNTSYCTMSIFIQDVLGSCDATYTIRFETALEAGIDSVYLGINGSNCLLDTFVENYFSYNRFVDADFLDGYFQQWGSIPTGYATTINAEKDINPLNGVTTYDLHLISMHILGIQPFDSPYQIIAADANQDGKVTSFDIVLLRKLILGIIDELPHGKSWRFLPGNYVFPNPQNPFVPPFPEQISISASEDPVPSYFRFIGVKIGDVNFSADPRQ